MADMSARYPVPGQRNGLTQSPLEVDPAFQVDLLSSDAAKPSFSQFLRDRWTSFVDTAPEKADEALEAVRLSATHPGKMGWAALKGAGVRLATEAGGWILGIPYKIGKDAIEVKTAIRQARTGKLAARVAIAAWSVPMTAYQFLDDVPGLFLYQKAVENYGTAGAYGLIAAGSAAAALAVGTVHRSVFKKGAELNGRQVVEDKSSFTESLADSMVASAAWEVTRAATGVAQQPTERNTPHTAEGAPIENLTRWQRVREALGLTDDKDDSVGPMPLPSMRRVAAYSAAYGAANTAVYAVGDGIPVLNTWTGFGVALAGVWLTQGAINGFRERQATFQAERAQAEQQNLPALPEAA